MHKNAQNCHIHGQKTFLENLENAECEKSRIRSNKSYYSRTGSYNLTQVQTLASK